MLLNFATANEQKGSLAQLNRASDYGSEGYRFESCRSHNEIESFKGSLAQLNRASDYGSEGYRFESCRSHKTVDLCRPFFIPHNFVDGWD